MSFHCHWRIHCSCRNGDAVDKTRNNPHSPTGTLSIDRVTHSDSESNPEADKLWFYIQSMTLVFPSRVCRLYRGAGGFFWLKCQPAAGEENNNYLNCNHFPGVSHSIGNHQEICQSTRRTSGNHCSLYTRDEMGWGEDLQGSGERKTSSIRNASGTICHLYSTQISPLNLAFAIPTC